MNLDAKRGKTAAIDTGTAIAGAVAAHALTNFASEKLMASNPTSTMGKFIPLAVVGVCLGLQVFNVVPKDNDAVNSALLGASVVSGMSAVRELSGANDDTKNTAGIAKLVAEYVPGLSGLAGLGNPTWDYTESAAALRQIGSTQMMLSQGGGWAQTPAPAAPTARPMELRQVG